MARLRIIRPNFGQMPAMGRIGREARLLFIQLWTAADDAGRLRLVLDLLVERLFPFDSDAPMLLPGWLDELERAGCIERYSVGGEEFLRIVNWRRLQSIPRPKRSRLPTAPSEPLSEHYARHAEHAESPESAMGRASEGDLHADFFDNESAGPEETAKFTPEQVRGYILYALKKTLASDVHTAPSRYLDMMGKDAGMWGGTGAPAGRKERVDDDIGPSPHELLPKADEL